MVVVNELHILWRDNTNILNTQWFDNGAFPLQREARFKRAVPGPFLVAFPLGVVPASGYYFTVFWLSKIEVLSGPTIGLSMLN